ncbi:MAG: exonuclease [Planctomycetota bacterium]
MAGGEVYVATAVETDGPVPGPHSLLSLASVAVTRDGTIRSRFTANLDELDGAAADPAVGAWWASQPAAWSACRADAEPPGAAMRNYLAWLNALPGRPVFVGYPASAAYLWAAWYLHRFTGHNPFGRGALDLRTMAMTLRGWPYRESKMRHMPEHWLADVSLRSYVAADRAENVARLLIHMLDDWRKLHPHPVGSGGGDGMRLLD